MIEISVGDVVLSIIYVIFFSLIFFLFYLTQKDKNPIYKFLLPGYLFKVLSAIFFLLIYIYYYKGGDTIGYFISSKALVNMLFKNPKVYFSILLGNTSLENYSYFDSTTGYPWYYRDAWSFTVVRLTSIFALLGFKGIMATTVLVATISYSGNWFLYKFFVTHYPSLKKEFALAILFLPSVTFWGSGILKDTYTLAASFFMFIALYQLFINKKYIVKNLIIILVSFWIIIRIKPYIFFLEASAFTILLIFIFTNVVKIRFLRILIFPLIVLGIFLLASWIYFNVASVAGGFYSSINELIVTIVVKQRDLTKEYYGGNSFNIGYFDPTILGIISKFFPATIAGFFRPFLWETKKTIMLMSGLETFLILIFFLNTLFNLFQVFIIKGFKTIKILYNPIIIYSIIYSIFFAFIIGLITANFGALVRYRIPFLPFFLALLFIINRKIKLLKSMK